MSRCTGHCCRCFPLPYGPEELQEKKGSAEDGEQIAAMVVYVGLRHTSTESNEGVPPANPLHFYSCSNLLPSGDCGVYETRPEMCRGFPYEGECGYTACTAREAA
jgi:Fe-S-cluster containining protein